MLGPYSIDIVVDLHSRKSGIDLVYAHGFVQTVSPGNEVVRVRRDAGTGSIVFPEAIDSGEQALSAIPSEKPWSLDTPLPQSNADSAILKGLRLRRAE